MLGIGSLVTEITDGEEEDADDNKDDADKGA